MNWQDRVAALERKIIVMERRMNRAFYTPPPKPVYWGDIADRPFSVHMRYEDGKAVIKCIGGNAALNEDNPYTFEPTVNDEAYILDDVLSGDTSLSIVYIAIDMGSTTDSSSAGFTATTTALANTGLNGMQYVNIAYVNVRWTTDCETPYPLNVVHVNAPYRWFTPDQWEPPISGEAGDDGKYLKWDNGAGAWTWDTPA